ncbi:extracellular solute-binding protein [Paenibacillus sp. JCM 10914]|uniref:sugar ABC transporter substrate-binding protein n=1 Tax=Paenibacillus sp. JCM 10914 TaxID=1236974 RepID=UPI0003CC96CA|nr:maltose ABC transporter substrate-binding protein [Paenibacillus sp. JCM 10914]GAE09639.1 maltose/maltodextrin ABC transporter, substrate binding periplasmic protein MalE [Paenibacillus sp. JCM 10914]
MKIKKFLTLAATFTLALSITACGGNTAAPPAEAPAEQPPAQETPAENTETQELKPEDGAKLIVWESRDERAYTDAVIKEFTEKYGVEVTVEEMSPTDQVTKLAQDGPSGLGADVVLFPHDNLGKAVATNLVFPNDFYEEKTRSSNTEAAIQGVSYDGVLYGYPRAAETYLMYYNKDLVKEVPTTMEEVIEFSKTFTDKANNKYGFMFETGNLYFAYPFLASNGGYIFGDGGADINDIGLNNEGAIKSMEVFASLKEILPVNSGDITPDIKRGLFTAGDLAMDINGPWELGGYKEALGDKLGVAPIPSIGGQPAVSFSGIKAWYVSSFTQYPQAARLFADFATSKEAQLQLSALVGSVPTNNEAQEDAQIKDDEYVSAFTEQFKSSQPMPSVPEMGNVWSPVGAALAEIWDNGKDVKETLDKAVTQVKDLNGGGDGK